MYFLKVMLIIAGVFWCKEILERLPSDIKTIRTSKDLSEHTVIISLWGVTIVIMTLIGKSLWNLVDLLR